MRPIIKAVGALTYRAGIDAIMEEFGSVGRISGPVSKLTEASSMVACKLTSQSYRFPEGRASSPSQVAIKQAFPADLGIY